MAFSLHPMEALPQVPSNANLSVQDPFNLPEKIYQGYDPKGKYDITGQPIVREEQSEQKVENVQQVGTSEGTDRVEEPPKTEESVKLAPKLSALARKDLAQRQREQALKQREQALEAKLADAERYSALKAKLAAKDFSAAEELGLSYDEYVKYKLDGQEANKPEETRYRKVEQELESLKKAQEELVNKEYQANQALWKAEVSKVVSENPDFSTIKELKAEDKVLQLINDSFDEDGIELSVEEAAKDIEEYLVEQANKYANLTKIKNKALSETKVLGPLKASAPKTITQNMNVTSAQVKPKPFHLLSESEQIAEAIRRVQAAKLQR